MVSGILGKKLGMTRFFREDGESLPVTVLQAGPCVVVQRKAATKDGYESAQLALVEGRAMRHATKPMQGHFAKASVAPMRFVREIRLAAGSEETKQGDSVKADLFQANDLVNVTGVSKGRGFAGSIRRHHFRGGAASHGSMFHRAPGSIGASSYPSRVWKGTRMAGHMGSARATVRNLEVVQVDAEKNLLLVKGAVPGPNGGYLVIEKVS
ncbi:MAG: 50S ribosomal protein L3 [Acidobacteria bacterium RIFCSPLOWO2_12_FULL_59_11]|nr:MAG: 50S ribosomal protein L3 [Acidobacteria bacterium RIFCSPLOWO2_12_FULL_59_11]